MEPTLINVTPAQSLWRDEVFGPVLAITTATGFDDAVRLANDTAFGLAAAVFTDRLTSATRFLDEAEAGQVAVNLPTAGWDVHHPFGGFRESGSAVQGAGRARAAVLHQDQDHRGEVRVVAGGTDAAPVGIIGAGIVGLAVARQLAAAGYPSWCSKRKPRSPPTRPGTTPGSCTPGSTTRPARPRRG